MIPKIIHCIWLSGDAKNKVYQDCIKTWKKVMPDYEIKEWSIKNLPNEVLDFPFVKEAIKERKWAYAADYIRLYVLYTYGGIYLDMDVLVYKRFDCFLRYRAFSCIEFNPRFFYKTMNSKEVLGLGIEAAVMGSEKEHPWIKDLMLYYKGKHFVNNPEYYKNFIMPRIVTKISIDFYGFRLVPVYQILREDIHIFPSDVFSSLYDFGTMNQERSDDNMIALGESPVRYAFHICAHSWYEFKKDESLIFKFKSLCIKIFGKKIISSLKNKFIKEKF